MEKCNPEGSKSYYPCRRSPDLCLVVIFFADKSVVDLDINTEKQVHCIKANHEKITKQYCWIVSGIASKTRVCRVLMTNHFHLIYSCVNENEPGMVLKNIKSFTALKIIDAIIKNRKEGRRGWML